MSDENSAPNTQRKQLKANGASAMKRKRQKRRDKRESSAQTSSEDDEEPIDRCLSAKAARNNLDDVTVRNIIKHVVQNERVLDVVHRRANELEKRYDLELERALQDVMGGDSADTSCDITMTRSRARELKRTPLKIQDLNAVTPDKNISYLVNPSPFPDSSEDEASGDSDASESEYRPNSAEESDDLSTTTCSDVESQPRTPAPVEDVFKVPQEVPIPKLMHGEISKRTRSKLSLQSTEIEAIQRPFVPPDIPQDIDWRKDEGEDDQPLPQDVPWREFLLDFQMPLKSVAIPAQDEENTDTDPEFVCHEEEEERIGDRSVVVVSRREHNLLIQDVIEGIRGSVENSLMEEFRLECRDSSPEPPKPTVPLPLKPAPIPKVRTIPGRPATGPRKTHTKNKVQEHILAMARPKAKRRRDVKEESQETQERHCKLDPDGIYSMQVVVPKPSLPSTVSLVRATDERLYLLPNPGASNVSVQERRERNGTPKTAFVTLNVLDDFLTLLSQINSQRQLYLDEVEREDLNIGGWTAKSLRIMQRQVLVHIQFLGQMFIQTCSHPDHWQRCHEFREMLSEWRTETVVSSVLQRFSASLQEMEQLCDDWERDLNEINERNNAYIQEQTPRLNVNLRTAERFLTHRAFLFPELLPKTKKTGRLQPRQMPIYIFLHCIRKTGYRPGDILNIGETMRLFNECTAQGRQATIKYLKHPVVAAFLESGTLPPLEHKEMPLGWDYEEDALPVKDQCPRTISDAYLEYIIALEERAVTRETQETQEAMPKTQKKKAAVTKNNNNTKPKETFKFPKISMEFQHFKAEFSLPHYYGVGDTVPEEEQGVDQGVEVLQRQPWEKQSKPKATKISKSSLVKMVKTAVRDQRGGGQRQRVPKRPVTTQKLTKKLQTMFANFRREYNIHLGVHVEDSLAQKLFEYVKELDIYLRLFDARVKAGLPGKRSRPPLINVIDVELPWKKKTDYGLPVKPQVGHSQQRDLFFAWRFLEFAKNEMGRENFGVVLDILRVLNLNSDSVVDLFIRLEDILWSDFRDMLSVLLVHLMPVYVCRVGNFLLQDVESLEEKLEIYKRNREAQLEEIFEALNELPPCPGDEVQVLILNILPVVSENPLLRDWVLQLLPQTTEGGNALQFTRGLGLMELLPLNLLKEVNECLRGRQEQPPMNLRLSDSEDNGEDDDSQPVVFVEEAPQDVSVYSVHSQESQ